MSSELTVVTYEPPRDAKMPMTPRNASRYKMQAVLNGKVYDLSDGKLTHMRYAPSCYASEIVSKIGQKMVGWPADVPFTDLSGIGGGVRTLDNLLARWNLPEGHPEKLRFEPASREDRENAARDPDSVHPTPHYLPELRRRAAAASKRAADSAVPCDVRHPVDMGYVGTELTSTAPPEPKAPGKRRQRRDTGGRRPRASDTETRVRRRLEKRGITSMECVLPGVDKGAGGVGDGRASKRRRLEELPVEDAITKFDFSVDFGGTRADPDSAPIEPA
ncbi:uncharacterized protein TRAVEDRAFT_42193 [Trametes versicolor FP-101664 SS1]|uniref:uncharacterized protein n=1 Tax=Trametes versicolor (strain FP-101664) TaxID=717944 RepID=UPI0004624121|nr:uncharacterized protein TRAVEDRAFT_42193 [Trametes versicolor FP-101664 SS1]EIW64776.1 hypothetical protein TRAVEDRAFT_42193 [Trametes versicolor FP-101664 SS1]